MKNKIGVFGYFALSILNRVYSLIVTEITPIVLGELVLGRAFLALYGFFIYKKRDLYGLSKETIESTN